MVVIVKGPVPTCHPAVGISIEDELDRLDAAFDRGRHHLQDWTWPIPAARKAPRIPRHRQVCAVLRHCWAAVRDFPVQHEEHFMAACAGMLGGLAILSIAIGTGALSC